MRKIVLATLLGLPLCVSSWACTGSDAASTRMTGFEQIYRIELLPTSPAKATVLREQLRSSVASRVAALGLAPESVAVSFQGEDELVLQLPDLSAPMRQRIRGSVFRSGDLALCLQAVDQRPEVLDAIEAEWKAYERAMATLHSGSGAPIPEAPARRVVTAADPSRYPERVAVQWTGPGCLRAATLGTVAEPAPVLKGASAVIEPDLQTPAIAFELTPAASTVFGDMTGLNKGQMLAFVLDGVLIQYATINDRIEGSGRISGTFTQQDVDGYVDLLTGGLLPARLHFVREVPF